MQKVACRSQRQLACLPGVGSLRGLAHNLAAAGVPSVCSVLGRLSTQFIYTHTPHVGIRIAWEGFLRNPAWGGRREEAKETWPSSRAPSHIYCWAHRREDNLRGNLGATMLQIILITVTVQGGLQSERMRWWIRSQLSVYVSIFPISVSEPKQDWI